MSVKNIVIGQKIEYQKATLAREFRSKMTPAEKLLWQLLRGNRVSNWHFRRQQIIMGFIVDFYCHKAALAIELDGEIHETQEEYDRDRDSILFEKGIRVLRIKNKDLFQDKDKVLCMILQLCEENSKTSPSLPASGREGAGG